MCHEDHWDRAGWRPFTSLDEYRANFEPLDLLETRMREVLAL